MELKVIQRRYEMFFHRMVPFLLSVALTSVTWAFERDPVEAFKPQRADRANDARQQDAAAD